MIIPQREDIKKNQFQLINFYFSKRNNNKKKSQRACPKTHDSINNKKKIN